MLKINNSLTMLGGDAIISLPEDIGKTHCGVEQWQLVGLITQRSLVRIQAPLLKKPESYGSGFWVNRENNLIQHLNGLFRLFVVAFVDGTPRY